MSADPTATEPFASFAASAVVLVVLAAWGAAEAVAVPIVPDVLIGILVLSAPWEAPRLVAAAIAGAVLGAFAMWWLLLRRPGFAAAILARQPGLGSPGLAEAEVRLRRLGPWRGFAQVGPGLPLKAYLHALARGCPEAGLPRVAALVVVNRLVRLGSVTIGFALGYPIASRLDVAPVLLGAGYVAGWTVFYLAYWRRRDPRRRGRAGAPAPGPASRR